MTKDKGPGTSDADLSAAGFRFAIIVSLYNSQISGPLLDGALKALRVRGAADGDVEIFRVPGSFELPQAASKVAQLQRFDAMICIGAVIRGETLHFELICNECARGLQEIALRFGVPVSFGVITANTMEQAKARSADHSSNKGWEAAVAAVQMAHLYRRFDRAGQKGL